MIKTYYLRKIRVGYGYSQAKVARGIGISPQVYHRYESGQRKLNLETLDKLAEFYGLSVMHFLLERPKKEYLPDWENDLQPHAYRKRKPPHEYSMVDLSYQFENLFIECNAAYRRMRNAVKKLSKQLKKEEVRYKDSEEVKMLKEDYKKLKSQLNDFRDTIKFILEQKMAYIFKK